MTKGWCEGVGLLTSRAQYAEPPARTRIVAIKYAWPAVDLSITRNIAFTKASCAPVCLYLEDPSQNLSVLLYYIEHRLQQLLNRI